MVVLVTERMRLRELTPGDADSLLGIFSDPEAMKYYPGTKDRDETGQWIARQRESYERNGFGLWLCELKQTGEFVGQCGLAWQDVEGTPEVEIGYLFLRRHWHRGFATEAAAACRDHGFDALRRDRLVSLIDARNTPSIRVAERIGLRCERTIRKWSKRVCVYVSERARGAGPAGAGAAGRRRTADA